MEGVAMAHDRRVRRGGFGGWLAGGGMALLLFAVLLGWLLPARAQHGDADNGARVGRLAATQGRVWLLDRGEDADPREPRDWRDDDRWHDSSSEPLVNWPVGRGDVLRTGANARATVQFDTLTLRLGADSELRIEQLDGARVLVWLPRGDLALNVLADPVNRAIEVRTPEGRLWPLRTGHYRARRADDSTQATAWTGEWRFDSSDSALTVPEGRRADFWQQGRPPHTHYDWAGVDRDDFATWARHDARADRWLPAGASPELASLPGAGDLQRWGDWRDDAETGRVWVPRQLPPGWAPYRDGRWVWVAPWGWTWVDAAPWGFVPFHYGQWLIISGRWAWSPGPRHERRRYVPVLPGWGHVVPRHEPPRHRPHLPVPRVDAPRPPMAVPALPVPGQPATLPPVKPVTPVTPVTPVPQTGPGRGDGRGPDRDGRGDMRDDHRREGGDGRDGRGGRESRAPRESRESREGREGMPAGMHPSARPEARPVPAQPATPAAAPPATPATPAVPPAAVVPPPARPTPAAPAAPMLTPPPRVPQAAPTAVAPPAPAAVSPPPPPPRPLREDGEPRRGIGERPPRHGQQP